MKILGSNSWQGFTQTKSGDGAITISGKLATIASGLNTGVAQLEKKFDLRPGDVVTLRVLARLKAGTNARLAISYPTAQAPKNTEYIKSKNWEWYTVRMAVPLTHNNATDFVNLILGTFNEDNGTVQLKHLEIDVEGSMATPRIFAAGKIKVLNGVPSIDASYMSHGITSLTLDLASNSGLLIIQTDYSFKTNSGFVPLPFVTHDGNLARNVHLGASMDNSGLGRVNVVFADAAGTLMNMANIANLAFNFQVIG
jgi:hypothetical protein